MSVTGSPPPPPPPPHSSATSHTTSRTMEKDDSEKCLYDKGTGECVGIYDEENDAMMPLDELDSDSD